MSGKTVVLIVLIIISILVVIKDFARDLVIELQIRQGVNPKQARKEFTLKKLLAGEYKNLFSKTTDNVQEPDHKSETEAEE